VLTATFNSYGDRQISASHKIDTPEPIEKKLCTVDYVHETTPYAKFGTNTHTGGKWVKTTKIIFLFIYTFFLRLAYRSDRVDGFLRATAQKT